MGQGRLLAACAAAALAIGGASAAVGATARSTFQVGVVVRTTCTVQAEFAAPQTLDGLVDLGPFTERCNDRAGYQVTLITPPGVRGEALLDDGAPIALATDGRTLIVDANTLGWRQRRLRLRTATGSSPIGAVRLEITPKGAVY